MATQTEDKNLEREYIIPLRKEWQKVANYRRTGRAIKAIKKFIARHMKVPERDVSKVKLDPFLNQEIWFRGKTKPPAKIKVKAIKQGEFVKVELAELPEKFKFVKQKIEKLHKKAEESEAKKEQQPQSESSKKEEPTEKKEEEKEKAQASADLKSAEAKQIAKTQKHVSPVKEPKINRMALKK